MLPIQTPDHPKSDAPTPYALFSRDMPLPRGITAILPPWPTPPKLTLYIALNLLDHRAIGIAWSRDEALAAMEAVTRDLHAPAASDPPPAPINPITAFNRLWPTDNPLT
jgi:hypothetical protein